MDSIESVKMSWQVTQGYTLTIFGIGMTALLVYLAGLIAFGVGIILSMIWVRLAYASIYHSVASDNQLLKNYGKPTIAKDAHPNSRSDYEEGSRLRNMLKDGDE